jgi:hypothetical protein
MDLNNIAFFGKTEVGIDKKIKIAIDNTISHILFWFYSQSSGNSIFIGRC